MYTGVPMTLPGARDAPVAAGLHAVGRATRARRSESSVETPKSTSFAHGAVDALLDEHVGRLEVAVHDAARVHGLEPLGDLAEHRRATRRSAGSPSRYSSSGDAVDELHHDVEDALAGHVDVDDADDARVVDLRGQPRLASEARERLAARLAVEQLEREAPLVAGALDLVDPRHAARADEAARRGSGRPTTSPGSSASTGRRSAADLRQRLGELARAVADLVAQLLVEDAHLGVRALERLHARRRAPRSARRTCAATA